MKKLLPLLFLLLITLPVFADEAVDVTPKKRSGFIPIPVLFYTPETGFGGGGSFVYFFRMPESTTETRASTLSAVAIYSQRNQYVLSVGPKLYFQNEEYFLDLGLGHQKFPDKFFGIGNNTSLEDEENYTPYVTSANLEFSRRWFGSLYAGLFSQFVTYEVEDLEEDGSLAQGNITGYDGGLASGLGAAFTWDTRDNAWSTRSGGYYRVEALFFEPAFGSDFSYGSYRFDIRRFFPLFSEQAIALQLLASVRTGDSPFPMMAILGGSQMMRGIYQGRYRDMSAGMVQAEYRFPIYWRFSGSVFAGTGDVAERLNYLNIPEFKYSVGGGIRFALSQQERINLRVDVGVSEDDSGFYFVFGEAF